MDRDFTVGEFNNMKKVPREFTITFVMKDDKVTKASILEAHIPQNGEFTIDNEYYPGELVLTSYIHEHDSPKYMMSVRGFKSSDVRIYNNNGRANAKVLNEIAVGLLVKGMVTVAGEIK